MRHPLRLWQRHRVLGLQPQRCPGKVGCLCSFGWNPSAYIQSVSGSGLHGGSGLGSEDEQEALSKEEEEAVPSVATTGGGAAETPEDAHDMAGVLCHPEALVASVSRMLHAWWVICASEANFLIAPTVQANLLQFIDSSLAQMEQVTAEENAKLDGWIS